MSFWYEESFGEDYLIVYKHRDQYDASREVERIVQWLRLTEKDLILDLCCGTGRHTINFARRGLNVVGLDLSKTLLAHAVKNSEGLGIPYVQGDMRTLPFVDDTFDAVLNLFTSFGYFSEDEDNFLVLKEIARVLKPNGRFLIDFLNREKVERSLVPVSERVVEGVRIREERWTEGDFVMKKITLTEGENTRQYLEQVKMYGREHLESMMEQAGLLVEKVYGNLQGEKYHPLSDRMILMGCVKK
jgi:ubiquinone/menaquinone biosynthesis C-methylase UbiE